MASKDSEPPKFQARKWDDHYESNLHVEPKDIETWLGDTPAVLIVDELNNLQELLKKGSTSASKFGHFIKRNFLDRHKRYFIFSSHILGALEFFSLHVDPSGGSMRTVLLQEIPILENLEEGMELKKNLKGPRTECLHENLGNFVLRCLNQRKDLATDGRAFLCCFC